MEKRLKSKALLNQICSIVDRKSNVKVDTLYKNQSVRLFHTDEDEKLLSKGYESPNRNIFPRENLHSFKNKSKMISQYPGGRIPLAQQL